MTLLKINCEGLSQKYINQLADDLDMLFLNVEVESEIITASNPLGSRYLEHTNQLCEQYGVTVTEVKV